MQAALKFPEVTELLPLGGLAQRVEPMHPADQWVEPLKIRVAHHG
jgi:hypothetical protein